MKLLVRRRVAAHHRHDTTWRLRMLDRALYSTYQDCNAAGAGEVARQLLERERSSEREGAS